jgi:hypothetical protein
MKRLLDVEYFKDHREFEKQIISCEVCGDEREFRDMNSMACVYRMPGKVDHGHRIERKASYQCPQIQHYGCCHDHAMLALLQCMFYHIHEGPHNAAGQEHEHELLLQIRGLLDQLITEESSVGLLKAGDALEEVEPNTVEANPPTPEAKAKAVRKKARHSQWQS